MAKTVSPQKGKAGKAPTLRGNSPAQIVRSANRWRDQYNPLRGLLISRVVTMLEAGERGEYAELQWLYRFIEKRFPVLRSLIVRWNGAIGKLDWDIKIMSELPEGATEAMAEKQQQFLRSRYELISNLSEAVRFLVKAEFRGFSILQKHRHEGGKHDGAVCELHWLPQWNFVRDGQFGAWYWNEQAQQTSFQALGEENRIDPADFLIREVEMPVNEIAVIAFVNCTMAKKDWVAFVEMFGLPGCVIEMPQNIPPGKEDEYRDAAEDVAESASGAIPAGAKAHFPAAQIRGNSPFKEFLDAEKEDVVLAGTGGKLTMLSAPTGIGSGASDAHQDVFDDLAEGMAQEISEIFQKQFDATELAAEFPDQPVCVYFELAAPDQEDITAVRENVVALEAAGYETDAKEVSEKIGLQVVRKAAAAPLPWPGSPMNTPPIPPAKPPIRNRNTPGELAPEQQLALARTADMQPIITRVQRILLINDPELRREKLAAFRAELPQLLMDINADPAQAKVLQARITLALQAGLTTTQHESPA